MLLAVAAPKEAAAAATGARPAGSPGEPLPAHPGDWQWRLTPLNERFDLVLTGVGKVNAAAGVLTVLDPSRHVAVLSVGVAGSLPGSGLAIGQAVAATASVYADEGLDTDSGFRGMDQIGFPLTPFPGDVVPAHPQILTWLEAVAEARGIIATVSTCSGSDLRAAAVRERTGAIAEAMEGAAIGHALARRHPGLPFGELRVISNRTGRREAQGWDLDLALQRLSNAVRRLDASFR